MQYHCFIEFSSLLTVVCAFKVIRHNVTSSTYRLQNHPWSWNIDVVFALFCCVYCCVSGLLSLWEYMMQYKLWGEWHNNYGTCVSSKTIPGFIPILQWFTPQTTSTTWNQMMLLQLVTNLQLLVAQKCNLDWILWIINRCISGTCQFSSKGFLKKYHSDL